MIYIEFERSRWAQHKVNLGDPSGNHPDPVIGIPEDGMLSPATSNERLIAADPQKNDLPSNWKSGERENLPSVTMVVSAGSMFETEKYILVWIKERGEWIVLVKEKWIEDGYLEDAHIHGPFALTATLARKILQAYGIAENATSISEVARASPERLEEMAAQK